MHLYINTKSICNTGLAFSEHVVTFAPVLFPWLQLPYTLVTMAMTIHIPVYAHSLHILIILLFEYLCQVIDLGDQLEPFIL